MVKYYKEIMLGNIVDKSNETYVIAPFFNIVSSLDDVMEGIPTLLVGFDNVKDIPDLDMTDRKLDDNLFWTFYKKERRDLHSSDYTDFVNYCFKNLVKDIKYIFVDPLHMTLKSIKKIINKINSSEYVTTYKYNDMLYIYCDKLIFGLDLKLLKFIGINPNKVKNKIQSLSDVFLEDKEILIEYKVFMERLEEEVKYIPYLHSMSNG